MNLELFIGGTQTEDALNRAERSIAELPKVDCPIVNRFTPGLYSREGFVPKGTVLTSRVHKFEHQFVILSGEVSVYSENEGSVRLKAPHIGITTPGTRRIIFAHEDTVWVTFHANPKDLTDPDAMVEELSYTYDNPFVEDKEDPRFNAWKSTVTPNLTIGNNLKEIK
jgi:hypothetical protein